MLKKIIESGETFVAPGAYDALSARIIEMAGFEAIYLTSYGGTGSLLAKADMGWLTMTEMVDHVRRISSAVDVPVIADAEQGYGDAVHISRTVEEFQKAGAQAIHIDDEVPMEAKCEFLIPSTGLVTKGLPSRRLISTEEMVGKIKAANDAKNDDFVIIVRCNLNGTADYHVDKLIERSVRYVEAGADMIFASGSEEDKRIFSKNVKGVPLCTVSSLAAPCSVEEYVEMGYQLIIYASPLMYVAANAVMEAAARLQKTGSLKSIVDMMITHEQYWDIVRLKEIVEQYDNYVPTPSQD